MPFEIRITRSFSASHQLRLYDQSLEPWHKHNWQVTLAVAAPGLDRIGVVMDFHDLERQLDDILNPMHNRHLNDLPAFAALNPTAENVAWHIGQGMKLPAGVKLAGVQVQEATGCIAVSRPDCS